LHSFLAPLLTQLDASLDARLVRTFGAASEAFLRFRHRSHGLLLSRDSSTVPNSPPSQTCVTPPPPRAYHGYGTPMMGTALTTMEPDDAAMRRVAEGDSEALAALFDRHKRRLFAFLYCLVGEQATAEDLVSETFLRLYGARAHYRAGTGFTPWLFAIARNLARGELRRRGVVQRAQQRLWQEAQTEPEAWSSDRMEIRTRVRAALARLPEEQRAAIILKEFQGLSYEEIGRVLGCNEAAARARTYRARNTLREHLRDWWEAEE
jgi:RNA polymerase sigma-70 factor, ECF subfamily